MAGRSVYRQGQCLSRNLIPQHKEVIRTYSLLYSGVQVFVREPAGGFGEQGFGVREGDFEGGGGTAHPTRGMLLAKSGKSPPVRGGAQTARRAILRIGDTILGVLGTRVLGMSIGDTILHSY